MLKKNADFQQLQSSEIYVVYEEKIFSSPSVRQVQK